MALYLADKLLTNKETEEETIEEIGATIESLSPYHGINSNAAKGAQKFFAGTQMAIVKWPINVAGDLLQKTTIKVGWVVCRVCDVLNVLNLGESLQK